MKIKFINRGPRRPVRMRCLDILSMIPVDNIKKYVDFGAKEGTNSQNLGRQLNLTKDEIIGIDVTDKSYLKQKEIDPESVEDIIFIKYDGKHLPEETKDADLFTALMVLHHVDTKDLDNLLDQIYNNLNQNGVFVIREHSKGDDSLVPLIDIEHGLYSILAEKEDIKEYQTNKDHKNHSGTYRSKDEWIKLLEKHGFTYVKLMHTNIAEERISFLDQPFYGVFIKI